MILKRKIFIKNFVNFYNNLCEPPISRKTPLILNVKDFQNDIFKTLRRLIRRYINLFIKGQCKLEQQHILPEQKKILWIFLTMPQIGDSLMDLSARILLSDKKVDLFSQPVVCNLMKYDQYFNELISNQEDLRNRHYDLIIIDAFISKSLRIKNKYFKKIPFVSMARFFGGPEFNRTLFSFSRMHDLLNISNTIEDIEKKAKLTITLPQNLTKTIKHNNKIITIAVGGKHPFRTYTKWDKLAIKLIEKYPDFKFIVVGTQHSTDISKKNFQVRKVDNYVGKLSIFETAHIIKQSNLLICADSGLLHIANAVNTPVLALFAGAIVPEIRMTGFKNSKALYHSESVNRIAPEKILSAFNEAIFNL